MVAISNTDTRCYFCSGMHSECLNDLSKGCCYTKLVKPNFNQFIANLVYEKHSNGHFARWMGLVTKHEQEANLLFFC